MVRHNRTNKAVYALGSGVDAGAILAQAPAFYAEQKVALIADKEGVQEPAVGAAASRYRYRKDRTLYSEEVLFKRFSKSTDRSTAFLCKKELARALTRFTSVKAVDIAQATGIPMRTVNGHMLELCRLGLLARTYTAQEGYTYFLL